MWGESEQHHDKEIAATTKNLENPVFFFMKLDDGMIFIYHCLYILDMGEPDASGRLRSCTKSGARRESPVASRLAQW